MLADIIREKTGIAKVPTCQIIGDVALLRFPKTKITKKKKMLIASALMEVYPRIKTVCEFFGVSGELRRPKIKKLAGAGTITVHKENGVLYKLDAAKIMFSKGNVSERHRLTDSVKGNEVIADMFAGIGYFSLPLARRAKNVYAIEKNPTAFRYLKENIKLNKLTNVKPMLGDCRTARVPEKADRILMGYFPDTEKFLAAAKKLAAPCCTIHYHNAYNKKDLYMKPLAEIKKVFPRAKIMNKKIVKSVGPNRYHVVVDFTA